MGRLIKLFSFALTSAVLAGCGEHSGFPSDPDAGNAPPEAQNVTLYGSVDGTLRPGMVVFMSGEYYDPEDDLAGSHNFRWLRDGAEISGATGYKYDLVSEDGDTTLQGCVTPVAQTGTLVGLEVCESVAVSAEIVLSNPPSAAVTITKDKLFFSGRDITSQYTFTAGDAGDSEGSSIFIWLLLGDNMPQVASCPSGELTDCTETLPENIAGYTIESCVLPVATRPAVTNPIPGALDCDETTGAGLTLTGTLEYRSDLVAQVDGFPSGATYHWYVDIADDEGPLNDTVSNEIETGNVSDFTGGAVTYNIGGIAGVDIAAYDTNGNGVIDDRDYKSAGMSITGVTHARYMLGKDVKVCISNTGFASPDDEVCALASEADDNGSVCADSSRCVAGGVYYDSTDLSARGISPVNVVSNTLPVTAINLEADTHFSRPISNAEYELRDTLGFGSFLPAPDSVDTYNGIEWIRYKHGSPSSSSTASNALSYCVNLTFDESGEWSLPVSSDSHSEDSHSGNSGGNNAPTGTGRNLKGLADVMIHNSSEGATMVVSPTWGWPLHETYASSTAASKSGNHYNVHLSTGSAQGYSTDSYPNYIACVLSD